MTSEGPLHSRKREILSNPPIVEAIFEIRWEVRPSKILTPDSIGLEFKFLPGRFYDVLKEKFPVAEPIFPNIMITDEMNPSIPRYRFRIAPEKYPLIQIGPGILTVNLDKNNFVSQDKFYFTCKDILEIFFELMPEIHLTQIMIHYIDAFEFNFEEEDSFEFLRDKLETNFSFSSDLFEDTEINPIPRNFHLEGNYTVNNPKGYFICKLRSGKRRTDNQKLILMDTIFKSVDKDIPPYEKLDEWIAEADDLIHKWFYKMVKNMKELW